MNPSKVIAKRWETVMKWGMRLLVVAAVLCVPILIIALVALKVDPAFAKELMQSFYFGDLEIYVTESAVPSAEFATTFVLFMMVTFLLGAGLLYVSFKLVHNILRAVIEGQPFHATVSDNLKKMGWVSIVFGVLFGVLSIVESMVVYYGYNLQEIMVNESVTKIVPQFTFDLGFVLVAAVAFLLSYIFKYGAELQQQVDETL